MTSIRPHLQLVYQSPVLLNTHEQIDIQLELPNTHTHTHTHTHTNTHAHAHTYLVESMKSLILKFSGSLNWLMSFSLS